MQHTLLPARERALLRREYRTRAVIIFVVMLSVAGLIGIGALLPAYTRAALEKRSELATISSLKKEQQANGVSDMAHELAGSSALVATASGIFAYPSLSDVMENIARVRGPIRLTSFSVARTATTSLLVATIQGQAPTRADVVAFKSRLEGLAPGIAVDLPLSELAKASDITFSLRLTGNFQ